MYISTMALLATILFLVRRSLPSDVDDDISPRDAMDGKRPSRSGLEQLSGSAWNLRDFGCISSRHYGGGDAGEHEEDLGRKYRIWINNDSKKELCLNKLFNFKERAYGKTEPQLANECNIASLEEKYPHFVAECKCRSLELQLRHLNDQLHDIQNVNETLKSKLLTQRVEIKAQLIGLYEAENSMHSESDSSDSDAVAISVNGIIQKQNETKSRLMALHKPKSKRITARYVRGPFKPQ
eukprot:UN03389